MHPGICYKSSFTHKTGFSPVIRRLLAAPHEFEEVARMKTRMRSLPFSLNCLLHKFTFDFV
jgi:hypothetical protein